MQVYYQDRLDGQAYLATLDLKPEGLSILFLDAAVDAPSVFWPAAAIKPAPVRARMVIYLKANGRPEAQIRFESDADYTQVLSAYPGRLPQEIGQATGQFTSAASTKGLVRVLLLAFAGLLLLGYLVLSNLGNLAIAMMPQSVDQKAGQAIYKALVRQGEVREDTILSSALEGFYKEIGLHSTFKPELHANRSAELNAFALPGGPIVVNEGLLKAAKTPQELAGVLAHELGHIEQRHTFQQLARMAAVYLIVSTLLGDVTGVVAVLAESGQQIFQLSYNRGMERDADAFALQTLTQARIDPRGLIGMFETLQRQHGASEESDIPSWLSTHPATEDRIRSIRKELPAQPQVDGAKASRLQAAFDLLKARLNESAE